MLRSVTLGLVLAAGSVAGKLPLAELRATAAQQAPSGVAAQGQPSETLSIVPPSKQDPFVRLFQSQPPNPSGTATANALSALTEKQQVVCGLTMRQVDPNTDAKIRQVPQASGKKPDFKIRRIEPTVCRP